MAAARTDGGSLCFLAARTTPRLLTLRMTQIEDDDAAFAALATQAPAPILGRVTKGSYTADSHAWPGPNAQRRTGESGLTGC